MLRKVSVTQVSVNACKSATNSAILLLTEFSSVFSFACMCAHLCILFVCFSCFTCVHAPRGETGCVGCYLLLQRVTANHQPWQTLWGEGREERGRDDKRESEREGKRGRRWRWAGGLAFEFHWVTTERFRSCQHNLCMSLDLSWTTAQPPTWPTDN